MKTASRFVILSLLIAVSSVPWAQADRNPPSASPKNEPSTAQPHNKEGKGTSEGRVVSVDLCKLAQEMSLSKDEAIRQKRGWMEIEMRDPQKGTITKGMPVHSDITITMKDKVKFFCATKHLVRIDSFARATLGANPACTSGAANSPFLNPLPTPKAPVIQMGPPVAAGCYKFSFTVWMTANPAGTHIDPHLIVKP